MNVMIIKLNKNILYIEKDYYDCIEYLRNDKYCY